MTKKVEEKLLRRLVRLIRQLPPEQRRDALQRLSQSQRLALESWMLREKGPARPSHRSAQERSSKPVRAAEPQVGTGERCRGTPPAMRRQLTPWPVSGLERVPGVSQNLQAGGCFFTAQLSIRELHLLTRAERSFQVALTFKEVLESIRSKVVSAAGPAAPDPESFGPRFEEAVRAALEDRRLQPQGLGLRFKVCLRPRWSSRPLCTRAYKCWGPAASAELALGLKAWHSLSAVSRRADGLNQQGASELIAAYEAVMQEAGSAEAWVTHRIAQLRAEEKQSCTQKAEAQKRREQVRLVRDEKLHQAALRQEERRRASCAAREQRKARQQSLRLQKTERAVLRLIQRWAALQRPVKADCASEARAGSSGALCGRRRGASAGTSEPPGKRMKLR